MDESTGTMGMGWLRDLPDYRDYTPDVESISSKLKSLGQTMSIKQMLNKVGVAKATKTAVGPTADLRAWCSPIENQLNLGSCTANAGVGMVEYFEKRSFGRHVDASRLFLYKVTRNLLGWTGDTGAYLRSVMGALVLFGVPPERYWPYVVAKYDEEPSAFLYAYAQSYQAVNYYRLDPYGTSPSTLLSRIKVYLAGGLPSIFGFTVYSSISQAASTGQIPFPVTSESVLGGHAIMAVGYDDNLKIKNSSPTGVETTGAFLIRNSWGTSWGDHGYGWLPYEYVMRGIATDWWSMIKQEWVDAKQFGL